MKNKIYLSLSLLFSLENNLICMEESNLSDGMKKSNLPDGMKKSNLPDDMEESNLPDDMESNLPDDMESNLSDDMEESNLSDQQSHKILKYCAMVFKKNNEITKLENAFKKLKIENIEKDKKIEILTLDNKKLVEENNNFSTKIKDLEFILRLLSNNNNSIEGDDFDRLLEIEKGYPIYNNLIKEFRSERIVIEESDIQDLNINNNKKDVNYLGNVFTRKNILFQQEVSKNNNNKFDIDFPVNINNHI